MADLLRCRRKDCGGQIMRHAETGEVRCTLCYRPLRPRPPLAPEEEPPELPANVRGSRRKPSHPSAEALSEYTDGCDIHPHCLSCPLPRCKYDEEDNDLPWHMRQLRDEAVRVAVVLLQYETHTRETLVAVSVQTSRRERYVRRVYEALIESGYLPTPLEHPYARRTQSRKERSA